METELTRKAIDIKGKKYVLVSDRVIYFNEIYKNGKIETFRALENDMEVFRAVVIPDVEKPERYFVGHSQATWGDGYINKTSALENAETSAVGRALAFMGIGVIESIASADEINKATTQPEKTLWMSDDIFNKFLLAIQVCQNTFELDGVGKEISEWKQNNKKMKKEYAEELKIAYKTKQYQLSKNE